MNNVQKYNNSKSKKKCVGSFAGKISQVIFKVVTVILLHNIKCIIPTEIELTHKVQKLCENLFCEFTNKHL